MFLSVFFFSPTIHVLTVIFFIIIVVFVVDYVYLLFLSFFWQTTKRKLPFKVLITDTKVERNTRFLVESVGRLKCNFPSISEFLFDAIDAVALEAKDLLTTVEDRALLESKFKELISLNQHLLNAIGVGHKSIDQVCRVALDHHLPSKLSGAGGGGCAFTFINQDTSPETIDKVVSELRGNGFQCYQVDIGCDGVNLQAPSENFK
eukprot:TRINITY_DN2469_c0_g2_i3.p1 TRINITY_DN2469_c0_g2~~TRINITY_DN2469_c0_g2_i3.p1  ORF type:complete len:205 (-),score=46.32 TRINITY_DN2469_c0_g2_i3:86-700(-)